MEWREVLFIKWIQNMSLYPISFIGAFTTKES